MFDIDTILEGLTVGDVVMKPSGPHEKVVTKVNNSAKMANQLSRLALDLANASQRLNREGETVPAKGRDEKIKQCQAELKKAMEFAESEANTNNYFKFDRKKWDRFKELLLDPDYPEKPGTEDARSFSRDCVNFSKYIKRENHVSSPAAENLDELKYVMKNSLKSDKHGEDYNINKHIENLSNIYKKRDSLIDKFNEIVFKGETEEERTYAPKTFRALSPENKEKVLKITKEVSDLEDRIAAIERSESKDYRLKARVAEKNRYEALRGRINSTEDHLNHSLTNSEKAEKYHKGIGAMGITKLNSFNKNSGNKILDLKTNPIDGFGDIRKLVAHWKLMGVKPTGQIEIVSTDGNGLGKVGKPIVNIKGVYYAVPRNHLIASAQGGIATKNSEYRNYTKNLTASVANKALRDGKITAEEAHKYDKFREALRNSSVMTEEYEDRAEWAQSLQNLKMAGVIGKVLKDGIQIEYGGKKYLINKDFANFPSDLRRFRNDIVRVFSGRHKGGTSKKIRYGKGEGTSLGEYKVGHRAKFLTYPNR